MKKKSIVLTTIIILLVYAAPIFSMEKIFYALRNYSQTPAVVKTIKQYHQNINVIIAQAYYVLKNGRVKGMIGKGDQQLAEKYNIKFMPMVTNQGYDPKAVTIFLNDKKAQKRTISALLNYCKQFKVYGLQIDFEHIPTTEKTKFNRFFSQLSSEMHKMGFKISIAVVPAPYPLSTGAFQQDRYKTWANVFDLKFLSQKSDFISLMAYDQHTATTTPGPIAGIPWDKKALDVALKDIPKSKLSFGIPTYSGLWSVQPYPICDNKQSIYICLQSQLSYSQAIQNIQQNHAQLLWDNAAKVNFAFYPVDGLYQYIFLENAKSFQYKLAFVKNNNLRGISVFSLGNEDPAIWPILSKSEQ